MTRLRNIREQRRIEKNNLIINNNNKNEANQPPKTKCPNNCGKEFAVRGLATLLSL
jgi:hypothetical protein